MVEHAAMWHCVSKIGYLRGMTTRVIGLKKPLATPPRRTEPSPGFDSGESEPFVAGWRGAPEAIHAEELLVEHDNACEQADRNFWCGLNAASQHLAWLRGGRQTWGPRR